ncbi:type I-E CRISPR-associated protein Cse2/CasB [Streptomyces sp. NPDC094049]|uniref:type I-E CRISPR-associated protein Cse2/CasB n=1 Tax=Streptomyces sp. NPDC094049 TaxID=3154987 RepID=UPI00332BC2C2
MTTMEQEPAPRQPAGPSPARRQHGPGPAGVAAARCVSRLQRGYRRDNPAAVADLARLRRGAGQTAHMVQDHWGLGGLEELGDALAESSTRVRREHAEEAVYLAVTLWALHQQSVRDGDMHSPGTTLGGAVRTLIQKKTEEKPGSDDSENEPLRKRLVRVGTADSIVSVAVRLREIVLLLRGGQVPLDYGRLADQLCRWQTPSGRAAVRREWGREFHLAAPRRGSTARNGDDGSDAIDPSLSFGGTDDDYGPGD